VEQLRDKHFISVGSFKPSMQELPDSVYALAQQVVADSDAAQKETGDLSGPLSLGLVIPENVLHIAELVIGKRAIDTTRTTVFKSVGASAL
jgi:ornithine cyclodeaminase/alanine dehydrogenase-like protein (mu-crystallin family)